MSFSRFARRTTVGLCAALALAVAAPAAVAAPIDPNSLMTSVGGGMAKSLQMGVGKSVIVDLPEAASEIYVGDPKVANAIVRSAKRIYISAIANGQTSIFALARDGRKIAIIDVSVGRDVGELQSLLNAAIPGNDIHVRTVSDSIILTGSVASAGDAQKAMDIASGFVNDSPGSFSFGQSGISATGASSGKVINSLIIRGLDQVSLRVTITEIRRDIAKQLGVNFAGSGSRSSFAVDTPFGINGALSPATQATIGWGISNGSLSATLSAYEREGVAHTLAEPTVTAVSGESAKFLAGGTIPVINSETCIAAGACVFGVVQQPYGVTLNFTPVVLSSGRIQLRIATEVTDIDYSKTVSIGGAAIPGFRTRNNTTTVELPSGGSIASAGLIATQAQQAINGLPGLMNLPILGALFRSHDYQRNETELLIVVTPYIVHAIDPKQIVRPDQNFQEPSDPQAWLLGRVNRIYSTSGAVRPMPGYTGNVGFITQ